MPDTFETLQARYDGPIPASEKRAAREHSRRLRTDHEYAVACARRRVRDWVAHLRSYRKQYGRDDAGTEWFANNLRSAWVHYRALWRATIQSRYQIKEAAE